MGDEGSSFWNEKYNFWSGTIGGLFLMLAYFGCTWVWSQPK